MPDFDAHGLARWGAVFSSDTRASILCSLMGGSAHTHTELARFLGRSASSVSEHVGVLIGAGLVTVEAQGRHRYVRLADRDVAEIIERLGTRQPVLATRVPLRRIASDLSFARSCYGHLAGELAVRLFDGLREAGWIERDDDGVRLTDFGVESMTTLGIEPAARRAPAVRECLDWSQRRHHLAGRYGDALLAHCLDRDWLRRHKTRLRVVQLTERGRTELFAAFPIEVP